MKKVVTLFIAVLYLAVSSGLAVEIHHCMGKIADISLGAYKTDACDSCGMPKNSGSCCKDEVKFVKIQDAYKLMNVNYELNVPESDINNNHFLVNNFTISLASGFNKGKAHSPPDYHLPSLCIRNCVFRI
ncbi:MAG: hypothetical protein ABIN89_05545 [Chitinophagaceae bacterium]